MQIPAIIRYVNETPLAIRPEAWAGIRSILLRKAAGVRLSAEEIEAVTGGRAASERARTTGGGIAVLGLGGTIAHRVEQLDDVSASGTSTQQFTQRFRQAVADDAVAAIVIDVDSPGGAVDGVAELASEIFASRGGKPIVAVANTLAASAAYWIASAADELAVTPSGEVGSIGVFAAHEDISEMDAAQGIKTTLISAGKFKTEASPFEPLTAEARAAIQARVDAYYGDFVKAVARGRGVKVSEVRNGFGQGRVVGAKEAVELGMADRVATLDETIARLQGPRRRRSAAAAAELDLMEQEIALT